MKSKLLLVVLIVTSQYGFTQTTRNFDFYNYDPKLINPAFAGLINEQNYQLQFRGEDVGNKYSPYTAFTAFSTRLNRINSGIGAMAWHSRIGILTENNASLLYNNQFALGDQHTLSIGTQIGFSLSNMDYSQLGLKDPNDPLIASGNNTTTQFIADLGIAYRIKKLSLGISTVNLAQSGHIDSPYKPIRRYNFYTQYEFAIASWLSLQPSLLVQTTFNYDPTVDFNVVVKIKDFLLLGTTTEVIGDKSYQKYTAGIDIRKRVQLIGTVYDGINQSMAAYTSGTNLQLMARVRVGNN